MSRIALCAILILSIFRSAGAEQAPDLHSFNIINGVASGDGSGPVQVTFLLDEKTGQTWMFAVVKGTPTWVSVSFSKSLWPNSLPELAVPKKAN